MSQGLQSWERLEDVPVKFECNLEAIDADNFIFAQETSEWRWKSRGNEEGYAGIYNYNLPTNKWSLAVKYPNIGLKTSSHRICYDKLTKRIFIHGFQGKMIIYDDTFKTIEHNKSVQTNPYLIEIDSKIHVIGGADNNYHLIWDDKKQKFDEVYKFNEWKTGNHTGGLIHVKSKNVLILLGGYDYEPAIYNDAIWTHKIGTSVWNKLNDIKLPHKVTNFCAILTSNEQYIIVMGGYCAGYRNDIWLLNMDTMEWIQSNIKLPNKEQYYSVLMGNKERDKLLVTGYIKQLQCIISLPIPQDIGLVIVQWYATEFIHLISQKDKTHWRIHVDIILSNV